MRLYQDTSNIFARYQGMPVRGLGAHEYSDVSKLNAPYGHTIPILETGAGSLSLNGLGVLGQANDYPWMAYSAATKELQELLNEALEAHDYCPIKADGKLGAGTCGAIRRILEVTGQTDQLPPATCQSFTEPTRPPCPGEAPSASRMGMLSSDTLWLVGGSLVAATAIGVAIYLKKRRR